MCDQSMSKADEKALAKRIAKVAKRNEKKLGGANSKKNQKKERELWEEGGFLGEDFGRFGNVLENERRLWFRRTFEDYKRGLQQGEKC